MSDELGEYTFEELNINLGFNAENDFQHRVYKQCGIYYKNKKLMETAINSLDRALEIKEFKEKDKDKGKEPYAARHDAQLFNKSRCLLVVGEPKAALDAAGSCIELEPANLNYKHNEIDCIYELDDFEGALAQSHNTKRLNTQKFNARPCDERVQFIRENLEHSVGKHAGPMLFDMRRAINKISNKKQAETSLWNYRTLNFKCLNFNNSEVKEDSDTPIMICRKKLNTKIINTLYLNSKTADDLQYLKDLKTDHRLDLPQCPSSSKNIIVGANKTSDAVDKFRNMLKRRQPVYSKRLFMCKDKKKALEYKNTCLTRTQREVRRKRYAYFATARRMMNNEDALEKLAAFTAMILGEYYYNKTCRIMPRKFEIINEFCSIVALAYIRAITVPIDLMNLPPDGRIQHILSVPVEKMTVEMMFNQQFGDREATTSPRTKTNAKIKKRITERERQMNAVIYPIEHCFFLHEIGRLLLSQFRYDGAKYQGRQVISKAETCGNYPWIYLGYLLVVRAESAQYLPHNVRDNLVKMQKIALKLNESVQHFNRTALKIVEEELEEIEKEKKRKQEADELAQLERKKMLKEAASSSKKKKK